MSLHQNNIHGYPPRNMFFLKQWNFLFYLFSPNDVAFLPAPFISTSCLWNEVAVCYYFGNRLPVIKSMLLVWLLSKVEGCCKATVLHKLVYSRWMNLPVLSLSVTVNCPVIPPLSVYPADVCGLLGWLCTAETAVSYILWWANRNNECLFRLYF